MPRYTDIDNLIKIIQDQIIDTNPNDLGYKVLTQFIAALNHAPIADVVPRAVEAGYSKQSEGEWVKVMNHKECSKCGYNAPYKKIKAGYHLLDLTNFCPNCGAKMKGGE